MSHIDDRHAGGEGERRRRAPHRLRGALQIAGPVFLVVAMVGPALATTQGRKVWSKTYDGVGHGIDAAYAAVLSPDGATLFVTGESAGSGGSDYATIAYDRLTGARRWVARYDGTGHGSDVARGTAVSPDGTIVFVTGESAGAGTLSDYATVAYDAASGALKWVARYEGPGNGPDSASSLATSPDGSMVVVTGASYGGYGNDYATVAYGAATGIELWTVRYDGPGHGADVAASVTLGPDGTVYVFGDSQGLSTAIDLATVAYEPVSGVQLWVARYFGPGYDGAGYGSSVQTSPDGARLYVVGQSFGMGTAYDALIVAYATATGQMAWTNRYDGPTGGFDYATDVTVLPDGTGVVMTGASAPRGTAISDAITVRYRASDGLQQWVAAYDGASHGDDVANAIRSTPDGAKVAITAWSTNDGTGAIAARDVLTVVYSAASGKRLWAARLDGKGHGRDEGNALALSGEGATVFVAGGSTGKLATLDFQTLAYTV